MRQKEYYKLAYQIYGKAEKETISISRQMATCLRGIGEACGELGDLNEKRQFLEEAVQICEKVYGKSHPETIKATHDLAEIGRAVQQECRDRSRMPSSA
eukprot:TRINITY_DN33424_c0_g1_i1.p1 TRINITY_DN33424_c0_g1~~TRINITY_DN33424_c0_g1_i1.p1  ORF type:complete len:113 (+),score=25.44 TRINITY_DN33424_c0_g1_i1:45-341(+)